MTSGTIKTRLTPLALCALLLSTPAAAQRRGRSQAPPPARPAPAQARPQARPQAEPQPPRPEAARAIEDILSADGYGVYGELRRVGTLVSSAHLKSAVASLRQMRETPDELKGLMDFAESNAEPLAESRVVFTALPTREGLPSLLVAVELATPQDAAAFEQKFYAFAANGFRTILGPGAPPSRARSKPQPTPTPAAGGASSFRRAGNWLLAGSEPFTLKKLAGTGDNPLSGSPRFQSARSRFASEYLFLYFDTDLVQQGAAVQSQRAAELREKAADADARAMREEEAGQTARAVAVAIPGPQPSSATTPEPVTHGEPVGTAVPTPEPTPADPDEELLRTAMEERARRDAGGEGAVAPVVMPPEPPPTEEQRAVRGMSRLFDGVFSGIPRIPGTVAVAATLEGDSVALRVAVENPPEGIVNVIPFLPNVISGPPVTSEAADAAPADSDIFVSGSLDWSKMYTAMLGTADLPATLNVGVVDSPLGGDSGERAEKQEKPPSAQETIAAVEKLFGFKFREDVIASLGNEVAVSLPFKTFSDASIFSRPRPKPKEETDTEPGLVVILTLTDPDKMKSLLPRLLMVVGAAAPSSQFQTEKREGFEVRSAAAVSYAVLDKFLVVGTDIKAVRHAVDAYAARRTLSATGPYRDSTAWQARQRLLQAYMSEALMRNAVEDTKKRAGGSPDPVVQSLLAQMNATPEPASYNATNEGAQLVHELRLPVGLIRTYAISLEIGMREAPVLGGEMMALFALTRLSTAQEEFKNAKKHDRYGTLEELIEAKVLDKGFAASLEYNIEVKTVGDKYEVSATPKNYGKTGRRSFLLDSDGIVHGADHKGQPATADDPPVD
ncbi:MAG TPA: DUF3352 domain-containing protein [Pyrinomonadaceae bacterium]|jgi:hypothetical protein|nr:DUF3352 domain-containing protein [Pyrinomonadaceae bacterium]